MTSIKCPSCGLVNFAGQTVCKRCQNSLSGSAVPPSIRPNMRSQSRAAVSAANAVGFAVPSLWTIIKNDYGAYMGLMVPLIGWGLVIATNVFGLSFSRRGQTAAANALSESSFYIYFAVAATISGVGLLVWRTHSFQQVFTNGENAVGQIKDISFHKDRGRIEYSYSVNGQSYQSGNAILKNEKTESFRNGDEIELIVDRSNPKRAFVKALYS